MSAQSSNFIFYSQSEYDRLASKNTELVKELEDKNQELVAERGKLGAERQKHIREIADLRAESERRLSLPRVHVIQEDFDELAALRAREREYQGNLADITRQADGFRLQRDDLQRQCERLAEAGNGMRGVLYETGGLLRRRADEARNHFPGLDHHLPTLSIAPRSKMGAGAFEKQQSEQSLFSYDPRHKPRVRLPSLRILLPQSTNTRNLALGFNGQQKPQFGRTWNIVSRPTAFSGTSLPLRRTPERTPRPSALALGHMIMSKESAGSQVKARDDASMAASSSSTNATDLQPMLAYPVAIAPPLVETFREYCQRARDKEAAAKRDTFKRLRERKEKERRLTKKARRAKGEKVHSDSSIHWTNSESSDEPNCPAPQKGPYSNLINDGPTGAPSQETPSVPALLNQPTKRKARFPPAPPSSKKQHTEHP